MWFAVCFSDCARVTAKQEVSGLLPVGRPSVRNRRMRCAPMNGEIRIAKSKRKAVTRQSGLNRLGCGSRPVRPALELNAVWEDCPAVTGGLPDACQRAYARAV